MPNPVKKFEIVVVCANTPERIEAGDRLAKKLEYQTDITVTKHVDLKMRGATPGWLDAIEGALERGEAEYIVVFPDDGFISKNLNTATLLEAVGTMARHGAPVADLHANHCAAHAAGRMGARWYTTCDGFTAFGAIASANEWAKICQFVRSMLSGKLVFDELVNVYCQMGGRGILKPTVSMCHQTGELPSLCGNDDQLPVMRRDPRLTEDSALPEPRTLVVPKLGRSYTTNHWRFLWGMTPAERTITGYAELVYGLHRDAPADIPNVAQQLGVELKAISLESSTGKDTSLQKADGVG